MFRLLRSLRLLRIGATLPASNMTRGEFAVSTALHDNLVHASPEEAKELEPLRDKIEEIYMREGKALLIGPNVNEEPVEVPGPAFEALKIVVEAMVQGQTIVLMPHGRILTSQEAADLLHVSRPH